MDINETLHEVGLEDKEAQVYLALLELGTATVHPIAGKAGVKRPTAYLILDELQKKGLVSVVPREKKVMYTAENPEKLLSDISRKQELIKRFMPNMLALYHAKTVKPTVQLFEGDAGIREVYKKIYASRKVSFFGTTREVQKYDPEQLWAFVKKTREEGVEVRDLLTASPEDLYYAAQAHPGPNYHIRFVEEGSVFLTDNAVFGDHVVFFSFHPQVFAVVITSREISQAIYTLFEFAWSAAKPYSDVIVNK